MTETKKTVKKEKANTKKTTSTKKKTSQGKSAANTRKTAKKSTTPKQTKTVISTQVAQENPLEQENLAVMENISPVQTDTQHSQPVQNEKGFFGLYFSTWKKSFSYKGRANRSEIFLFPIFNLFIFCALLLISLGLDFFFENNTFSLVLYGIQLIFALLTIPASISLLVRRFHDFNKSAIYAITPYVIMIAGFPLILEIMKIPSDIIKHICTIILFMIWITSFIWTLMYMFRSGTKGENKYGIQPLTKKRIIWLNLLVFVFTIILYLLISVFAFLYISFNYPIDDTYLQKPFPVSSKDFPDTLSEEELEAEALKVEKFINSLTDEEFVEETEETSTDTQPVIPGETLLK